MKVIVNIDESTYEYWTRPPMVSEYALAEALVNGTPIPDNATNGDMLKAMFPDIKIHKHKKTDICDAYIQIDIWDFSICVSKDWWDAPYKRGNEE